MEEVYLGQSTSMQTRHPKLVVMSGNGNKAEGKLAQKVTSIAQLIIIVYANEIFDAKQSTMLTVRSPVCSEFEQHIFSCTLWSQFLTSNV